MIIRASRHGRSLEAPNSLSGIWKNRFLFSGTDKLDHLCSCFHHQLGMSGLLAGPGWLELESLICDKVVCDAYLLCGCTGSCFGPCMRRGLLPGGASNSECFFTKPRSLDRCNPTVQIVSHLCNFYTHHGNSYAFSRSHPHTCSDTRPCATARSKAPPLIQQRFESFTPRQGGPEAKARFKEAAPNTQDLHLFAVGWTIWSPPDARR